MEEYMSKYDSLNKHVVFRFYIGNGGIGDLLKFFMYVLNICIKHDIKLSLLTNTVVDSFLKLKCNKMYITDSQTLHMIQLTGGKYQLPTIEPNIMYMAEPSMFYWLGDEYDHPIMASEVFDFTHDVKRHVNITPKYISVHLRLGDKHLDTDKEYVHCKEDERYYNQEQLFNFIETNRDKNILFFCDNGTYKKNIKSRYDFITIIDSNIGHTSFANTTVDQVFNTVVEFYILSKSEHIYAASESGFSRMASRFYNVPFSRI
jgi:hypothetical protein